MCLRLRVSFETTCLMSLMKSIIAASQHASRPGFIKNLAAHCVCFYPRSDKLLVTFDHLGSLNIKDGRLPWGLGLAETLGWLHLGNLTKQNDWFRHKDMFATYRNLRKKKFFESFDEVVFLEASMGGYAACAFSVNSPGARVVAFSPQSTLRRDIAPFESRFHSGRKLGDWTGPWVDGPHTIENASNVKLFYDPYFAGDAMQAARYHGDHIERFKAPFMGHKLPSEFKAIGQFEPIALAAIQDDLSQATFHQLLQGRRRALRHGLRVLKRAQKCGHSDLVARVIANGTIPYSSDYIARMARRLSIA